MKTVQLLILIFICWGGPVWAAEPVKVGYALQLPGRALWPVAEGPSPQALWQSGLDFKLLLLFSSNKKVQYAVAIRSGFALSFGQLKNSVPGLKAADYPGHFVLGAGLSSQKRLGRKAYGWMEPFWVFRYNGVRNGGGYGEFQFSLLSLDAGLAIELEPTLLVLEAKADLLTIGFNRELPVSKPRYGTTKLAVSWLLPLHTRGPFLGPQLGVFAEEVVPRSGRSVLGQLPGTSWDALVVGLFIGLASRFLPWF